MLNVGDTFALARGDRSAKATVCLIGEAAETEVVCFYVFDATSFADEEALKKGFSGTIAHVPISSDFAMKDLGKLISTGDAPPDAFALSHKNWVENMRIGQAGWFEKSLPDTLDQIFSSMIIDGPAS